MGVSSSPCTTTRLHPSAPCLSAVAQLWACPLGYEMLPQLCQLCLYSCVQQHPLPTHAAVHTGMPALTGVRRGWHCQGRTGTPSRCSGAARGVQGSPQQGAQCCGDLPMLELGGSPRLSPVHPSEHALPVSQKLLVGCLRGSCSPQLLFPWRSPGLAYDQGGLWPRWAAHPLVAFAQLFLGRERSRGCPAHRGPGEA